jgi:hypothetical protein
VWYPESVRPHVVAHGDVGCDGLPSPDHAGATRPNTTAITTPPSSPARTDRLRA